MPWYRVDTPEGVETRTNNCSILNFICLFLSQADSDGEMSPISVRDLMDADDARLAAVATARVACACHTLQLAVRDGLKDMPNSISRAVARVNASVAAVKRSTLAAEVCVNKIKY